MAKFTRKVYGAKYGIFDWLIQRITAVIMLVFFVALIGFWIIVPEVNFNAWHSFFANIFMRVITIAALFAICYHAWIGIRDIWMDYIKPVSIRLFLHTLTIIWLVVSLVYGLNLVWSF